jgi:hypothetical protein
MYHVLSELITSTASGPNKNTIKNSLKLIITVFGIIPNLPNTLAYLDSILKV